MTPTVQADPVSPTIAVAIPCYNEAAAIGIVIAEFRATLPTAEIVVFDNNSTDDTAARARAEGARVIPVPDQGKGYAVRAAFSALSDFDIVVLTDGDGTYPAEAAPRLVETVLEGAADMAVGARQPAPGAGAMSPVRGLGNVLIRSAFWLLIGPGNRDLLSGYRVFSRRFRQTVVLRAKGFEIEAELASEAIAQAASRRDSGQLSPARCRHRKQTACGARRRADYCHDCDAELAPAATAAPDHLPQLLCGPCYGDRSGSCRILRGLLRVVIVEPDARQRQITPS